MKKLFLIFFLSITIGAIYYFLQFNVQSIKRLDKNKILITPAKKIENKTTTEITNKSIFVPYWNIDDDLQTTNYDRYLYFGISASSEGINKEEVGFSKLSSFAKATAGKDTYLTLRLLDNDFNRILLKDEDLQLKIIEQTLEITKENNFKGVVLDLELFSLFNTDIKDQINKFVQTFYTASKSNYKTLALTIYGDVFYRKRPYDLSFLAKNSDEILVMAYDFSKSIGEPGPNFPFDRRSPAGRDEDGPEAQIYNYDFQTMIKDFLKYVPKEKISIIFGMYGYDWQVDEKKRPITTAKALTLKEIKSKFMLDTLRVSSQAAIKRDEVSKETEINYTISSEYPDEQGIYRIDYHIIWFEDEESVEVKSQYLQEQGIGSVGYWAYGYF